MFSKAIVIGRGKTAVFCACQLAKKGIQTEFYTLEQNLSPLSRKMQSNVHQNMPENKIVSKREIRKVLLHEKERTLLVSAVNSWLIPNEILEKKNLVAINFHNALLPSHPGRNAEAWCIYDQDFETGITWHVIEPQVDAGDILIQKAIPLTAKSTSFSLLQQQNKLAVEAFNEILPALLKEQSFGIKQVGARGKLHYSWEIPNNGVLDLNWPVEKISAFLRSMDYGPIKTLGSPYLISDGKKYIWDKYTLLFDNIAAAKTDINTMCIRGKTLTVELHGLRPI